MFVRPGPDTKPVPKVSFVARVGDIYSGVGYYKWAVQRLCKHTNTAPSAGGGAAPLVWRRAK